MWLYDMPVGLACLTNDHYVDKFVNEINNNEHLFLKDIIKHTFNSSIYLIYFFPLIDPDKRIKLETILKKLKNEKSKIRKSDKIY